MMNVHSRVVGWPDFRDGISVVGHWIERFGFAHAFAFVEDDDAVSGTSAFETDLDSAVGQVARGFEADGFERKSVVGTDGALLLDEEEFVVGLVGRQVTDPATVESETVQSSKSATATAHTAPAGWPIEDVCLAATSRMGP